MSLKTVAIVGRGKTREHAPYDNPDIDIWGMVDFPSYGMKRVTAMFEMHNDWYEKVWTGDTVYKEWLQQPQPFPIYMKEVDARVPSSVKYPEIALPPLFKGDKKIPFYTSTTPYAIALAVHLKYERIELYGIELAGANEYEKHRDSVFFWIGYATGAGVQVGIHEDSQLYKACVYP